MTGTYTGQFVMSGFLNLHLRQWQRISVTRAVRAACLLMAQHEHCCRLARCCCPWAFLRAMVGEVAGLHRGQLLWATRSTPGGWSTLSSLWPCRARP